MVIYLFSFLISLCFHVNFLPSSAELPWQLGPCTKILQTGRPSLLNTVGLRSLCSLNHPFLFCQATVPWNFWKISCREGSSIWEGQWIPCLWEQWHYRLCKQWGAAKKHSRGSSYGGAWVLLTVTSFNFPYFEHQVQATENADVQGEITQLDAFLKPGSFHGGKLVTLVGNKVVCNPLWFSKQFWGPTFLQVVPIT